MSDVVTCAASVSFSERAGHIGGSFVACTVCSGPVFVLFYLSISKGVGFSVPLIYLRRGVRIDAYNTSGRFNFRWVVSCSFYTSTGVHIYSDW